MLEAGLKEKAVLRTRRMLLVPDKWCLTVRWPLAHPPDLWNVLCLDYTPSQPGPDLERSEARSPLSQPLAHALALRNNLFGKLSFTLGHPPHSRGYPLTCGDLGFFVCWIVCCCFSSPWFLYHVGSPQNVKQKTTLLRMYVSKNVCKLWLR